MSNAYADYKGSGYHSINSSLRAGKPNDQAKRMKAVFEEKSVEAPGVLTLHRGTSLPAHMKAELKVGATFEDKGFMSTSYSPEKAFNKDIKFVITAPKGTKVLAGTAYEKELILGAGTKLKITAVKEPESKYGKTVVHATVIA